jgi:hypothetical protein
MLFLPAASRYNIPGRVQLLLVALHYAKNSPQHAGLPELLGPAKEQLVLRSTSAWA